MSDGSTLEDEGCFLKDADSSSPNPVSDDDDGHGDDGENDDEEEDDEDYWALDSFQGEWEIPTEEALLMLFSSVNNSWGHSMTSASMESPGVTPRS